MKIIFAILVACGLLYFISVLGPLYKVVYADNAGTPIQGGGLENIEKSPGEPFNINDAVEPGLVTVVVFYANSCGYCRRLNPQLERFSKYRPDVAVRKIRIPDAWNPSNVLDEYGVTINTIPHAAVYDEQGKLLYGDNGSDKAGYKFLLRWINAEHEKR